MGAKDKSNTDTDVKKEKTAIIKRSGKKPRKPRRFKPGTVAVREIRRYQKGVEELTKYLPISRIVRQLVKESTHDPTLGRMKKTAIKALQIATEKYAVDVFQKAQEFSLHANRITIYPADLKLADKELSKRMQLCKNMAIHFS